MRFLLLVSVLALVACLAVHAWCAVRVLALHGGRLCRCNLACWEPPGECVGGGMGGGVARDEASALSFASQLHRMALDDWRQAEPRAWRARVARERFALVVPALAVMAALFASLAARLAWLHSLTGVVAVIALIAVFSLLSLPGELAAIHRTLLRTRRLGAFPHPDDEIAIARCVRALAWDGALPMVLKWVSGRRR